jgi:hypothetical protein
LLEFGLPALAVSRLELRRRLADQIRLRPAHDYDLLRVLLVQLFSIGKVEDSLLIWQAKCIDFDTFSGMDVQYMCGAGLAETKSHLLHVNASELDASAAYDYLCDCETSGDFAGWTPQTSITQWRGYYGLR